MLWTCRRHHSRHMGERPLHVHFVFFICTPLLCDGHIFLMLAFAPCVTVQAFQHLDFFFYFTTKKCSKCLANTKNGSIFAADKLRLCNRSKLHCSRPCIIFAMLNKKEMNEKKLMRVTAAECELLEAIRNYNKSYPDGYPELMWYAQQLFDNMLRQPYQ